MNKAIVTLKKGEGRMLKSGGAWIFDNEIESVMGNFDDGDIVLVHDFDGYPLGRGFINRHSKIRVRMLTRNIDQEINEAFFAKRLRDAWEYRKKTVDISSCRIVFGEADFLPGMVIDKFSDVLVFQALALGIDRYKELLIRILREILQEDGIWIHGVYERSDAKEREKEGLSKVSGFFDGKFDTDVEIVENGVRYLVDVKDGQKTGFFLDQKYNRLAIQRLCKDAKVLDCFTHTGSFALNAGIAGASSVLGVDASELAIKQAEKNAELIAEIEGGIKKEVSVGCSMGKSVCSICGAVDGCGHEKGQRYGGKLCFRELRQPLDAYEWSFVAVPAQRSAGILKRFCQESEDTAVLRKQAALGVKYLASLRREVVRLAMLADDALDGEAFSAVAAKLDEPELLALHKSYAKQAARRFPTVPQLGTAPAKKREDETVFLV